MTPHVIQDSDDEGSDLSPVKSPVAPGPAQDAPGQHEDQPDASLAPSRSGSTDPSFFQRIYDEHNQTGSIDLSRQRQIEAEPNPDSGLVHIVQNTRSSLTDPTMAESARSKTAHVANAEYSSACTQVSTTEKPGRQSEIDDDIWDIPISPEANVPERKSARKDESASVAKVYGKRKKISHQSVGLEDSRYDDLEAPSPATPVAKRARHDDQAFSIGATTMNSLVSVNIPTTMNQVGSTTISALKKLTTGVGTYGSRQVQDPSTEALGQDSVSLITVPVSDDRGQPTPVDVRRRRGNSSGLVTETQLTDTQKDTRIEVKLSQALSSSEKQAYRIFNLSGDSDTVEAMDSSSLALPLPTTGGRDLNRSSGDATEAATTPSAYAGSSARRTAENSDLPSTEIPMPPPSTSSTRGRKRKSAAIPTSSPDIISGTTTRSAKKRKFGFAGDDELGAHDETVGHSPSAPRSSRLRSSALDSLPDTQPPPGGFQLPHLQECPAPAADAAKLPTGEEDAPLQETGQSLEPILISSGQEAAPEEPTIAQEPLVQTQKKRGRKKKEAPKPPEVSPVPVETEERNPGPTLDNGDTPFVLKGDTSILQPTETSQTKPKRKRGRPKKSAAKVDNMSTNAPVATVENDSAEVGGFVDDTPRAHVDASGTSRNTGDYSKGRQKSESSQPSDARDDMSTSDGGSRHKSGREGKLPAIEAAQANMQTNKNDEDIKDGKLVKPPVSAEPIKKEAATCSRIGSQVGKATYRVGLSKRTRIAPLLKSLRK
ncbi:hypothetical protein PpBr36_04352 [Pyricularia pennisetigena]|uniref:hypothetical protein n=1 Tax=Pyricularia pennisetigena TaxID=1578925 RepID=UPI001150FC4E|nr:hypothetical protein PpBr36_04352 [Pyricularia pennisetigena]TLS27567.1 hypothetical protein PpBr36_04352 [Pyricularia pennisetigena]